MGQFSSAQVTTSNKKIYKAKLARSIYQVFPRFFSYNASRDTAANKIDAKSDLYIYFYLHGLSLLNPNGSFCFITSNSWLDVGYGKCLQEFLLKHCHIKMVIDNQAKRSFASADVNTVIVLFSSPNMKKETRLEETARFVMFKEPFEHILSPVIFEEIEAAKKRKTTPEYRVNPIVQKLLLEDGCEMHDDKDSKEESQKGRRKKPVQGPLIKVAKYIGNKWGGKYLRAPDIYWTILKKGKDKLVRLGDVAEVRFGIKTGANDFFFLDKSRSKELDIEKEFLMPVIKSPRESKHLRIVQKNLKYNIIMCHKNKHELKGTKILEHIKWGEEKGYHKRPSCAGRKNWWDLGQWAFAQLLWVEIMFASFRVYINSDRVYESDKFYGIISHTPTKELCLTLNSSILLLWKLLSGFSSLGQGALKTPVYEVKNFLIPSNTEILTQFNESMLNRSIENIDIEVSQADRKELDSVIFDYLKLTQDEGEAVYEAIINLYEARLNKAKSLNPMR